MKRGLGWFLALCVLALAGCMGGPGGPAGPELPLPADQARLYIYRAPLIPGGSPVWTTVSLDHRPLGVTAPGTVFYRDVPPGTYEVEVRSDYLYPDQFKTVRLAPGSRTYVEIQQAWFWGASPWGMQGATFTVRIVDPVQGARQIADLLPTRG